MPHYVSVGTTIGTTVGTSIPIYLEGGSQPEYGVTVGVKAVARIWSLNLGTTVGVETGCDFELEETISVGTTIGMETGFGDGFNTSELVDTFAGSAPNNLWEESTQRTKRKRQYQYGNVVVYGRTFTCAKGDAETIENTTLNRGAPMYADWLDPDDAPSRYIDGPVVDSVERQQARGSARDQLRVSFLVFILPNERVSGYNETARSRPVAESAFTSIITTYGIVKNKNASNVPEVGDYLDGQSLKSTTPICRRVDFDHYSVPGRILVTAEWVKMRAPIEIFYAT